MSAPKRIHRLRTAGSKLPAGSVYVGRPSRWGNPFLPQPGEGTQRVVDAFREQLLLGGLAYGPDDVRRELAGKDLSCWCPLDQPCHADVLLELANAPGTGLRAMLLGLDRGSCTHCGRRLRGDGECPEVRATRRELGWT